MLFRASFATVGFVAVASEAMAVPLGAFWVERPVVNSPGGFTDVTGFRSFDLFVRFEPGDGVVVQDFGGADPGVTLRLGAGQDYFQHPIGDDITPNPELLSLFPNLTYDTRGHMGDLGRDAYQSHGSTDWSPDGLFGIWGVIRDPVTNDFIPTPVNSDGNFWFGRFTVNSAGAFGEGTAHLGEFLGGGLFISGFGLTRNFGGQENATIESGFVDVPNAFTVPSPGGAALGACCSLGLLRRRRRAARSRSRSKKNCCTKCGYDLRELTGGRCPECGEQIQA